LGDAATVLGDADVVLGDADIVLGDATDGDRRISLTRRRS
jgi:hypothetical protein